MNLTVFAKEENNDIQIYKDQKGKIPFARFPYYYSNKPKKNQKKITLNCFTYDLEWI